MIINFPIDNKYMEEIVNGMLEFDRQFYKERTPVIQLIVPEGVPEYQFAFEIEKVSNKYSIREKMRKSLILMFKNNEWDMVLSSDEWKLTTKVMGYSTDNRKNVILVQLSVIKYEKVK